MYVVCCCNKVFCILDNICFFFNFVVFDKMWMWILEVNCKMYEGRLLWKFNGYGGGLV